MWNTLDDDGSVEQTDETSCDIQSLWRRQAFPNIHPTTIVVLNSSPEYINERFPVAVEAVCPARFISVHTIHPVP